MTIRIQTNQGEMVRCNLMGCNNLCNSLIGLCDPCLDEVYRQKKEEEIYNSEKENSSK